jgi:hypothetical protein
MGELHNLHPSSKYYDDQIKKNKIDKARKWIQYVPPKRRYLPTSRHWSLTQYPPPKPFNLPPSPAGGTTQKTNNDIFTAAQNLKPNRGYGFRTVAALFYTKKSKYFPEFYKTIRYFRTLNCATMMALVTQGNEQR